MSDYHVEPSDFMDGWFMVQKSGERTQHFKTAEEAERYASSPFFREQVAKRRSQLRAE